MKHSILSRACIVALSMCALAFAAVPASAATYSHSFTDGSASFSIDNAYAVHKVAGAVQVVAANGTAYTYADASGALYTKLVNYMAASGGSWYTVPGTFTSLNLTMQTQVSCSGTTSYFGYPSGGYVYALSDNCAARNAVIAGSN